jgi:hypothetical protein
MPELNGLSVLASRLYQIAFVVSDLSAAETAARQLGARGFQNPQGQLAATLRETFRDQPSGPSALSVRLGYLGQLQIELVEFESGESSYGDFVVRHATGMHHLGFLAHTVDEFHELEGALAAAGMPIVQAGQADDGTLYSYADAERVFGCYLMLVCPGSRLEAFFARTQLDEGA